jgi:hypothetical protein
MKHLSLFIAIAILLTACLGRKYQQKPAMPDEIRLYSLDRDRTAIGGGESAIELYPFLIQFPNNDVFDLDAPIYNIHMEPVCEGVITALHEPLVLKIRFLDNTPSKRRVYTGHSPMFDTTLVIDPNAFPPGDYELVKQKEGTRFWLEMKPWPPNDKRRKSMRKFRRDFAYNAQTQAFQGIRPAYAKSLNDVWPNDKTQKGLPYVEVIHSFKRGTVLYN